MLLAEEFVMKISKQQLLDMVDESLRFFSAKTNGSAASIFRILFGLLATVDGVRRWANTERYRGESGAFPWDKVDHYPEHIISVYQFAPENPAYYEFLGLLPLLTGLALVLGILPRLSMLIYYLTMMSMHHRNPFLSNGGDQLILIVSFLSLFLPLGARFRFFNLFRKKAQHQASESLQFSVWPQRLIGLQICYVYLGAFASKALNPNWRNGEAMMNAFMAPELSRFLLTEEAITPLIKIACVLACWSTLAFELFFPVMVWHQKIRLPLLLMGILFHLSIEATFTLPTFSALMMITYILFVSDEEVEWLFQKISLALPKKKPAPSAIS